MNKDNYKQNHALHAIHSINGVIIKILEILHQTSEYCQAL